MASTGQNGHQRGASRDNMPPQYGDTFMYIKGARHESSSNVVGNETCKLYCFILFLLILILGFLLLNNE